VKIDDVAFYGEKQCYKYYVKEPTSDIHIKLAQFSGIVSYTFNHDTIPDSFENSTFKQSDFGNSELVITVNDRIIAGYTHLEGLYYLCVFAHMTSTYSIVVEETEMDQKFHSLEDGWDQNGEVRGNDTQVYLYKVPPLDFTGEDIMVEFLLTSVSGDVPKMFAKFCKEGKSNLTACGEGFDSKEAQLSFQRANAVGKGLSLIIDHDEGLCATVYQGECFYTILVVG